MEVVRFTLAQRYNYRSPRLYDRRYRYVTSCANQKFLTFPFYKMSITLPKNLMSDFGYVEPNIH